ncbi:MAG: amino acid permease [Saprospiraceae bacterium]|nr:amino acid permease [Saprospiraceae bacterium]
MLENNKAKVQKLGLWMSTALVAGTMIGSGVFLLPASLAAYGGISLFGWIFTTIGAFLLASTLSSLSKKVPKTGGPYAYTQAGFGDFAGFLVGWGYWISLLTGSAAIAVAAVGYLAYFFPLMSQNQVLAGCTAMLFIWLLTTVNMLGTRRAGALQLVTTILKILPLIMVIVLAFFQFDLSNFQPFNASGTSSFSAITSTATLTLWAFLGLESATVAAENVEDPERNVTRATMYGTIITAFIYILGTMSVMGILPQELLSTSTAPFADAARQVAGEWAGNIVAIGAVISCIGALNGMILLQGQMPFALARDGLFGGRFGKLSRMGTPIYALGLSGLLVTMFMIINYTRGLIDLFTFIIRLSTLSILLPYSFSAMAELRLLHSQNGNSGTSNKVRKTAVACLAFAYSIWAISGSGQQIVYLGFILFLLGMPFYVLFTKGTKL